MQKTIFVLRNLLPRKIRRLPIMQRIKNFLNSKFIGHDGVYNEQYYLNTVETPAVKSAGAICSSIMEEFRPRSLIDIGCGTGALMENFQKRGVKVKGLEYSEAALAFCRRRNLDVKKFDLETDDLETKERYDVAISMEVAEHLPKKIADEYVGLLARLSDIVVFTAAPPGQGGQDHVNEQAASYWIEKFASYGFSHDLDVTNAWKGKWRSSGSVAKWYSDNLLVFVKRQ
jgi:SAM-dependent methyltransferase